MYELFTKERARNEQKIYQRWYVESQMKHSHEKGIKPVIGKILDTFGL